jgi:lysine-specific demethylase/histidyl-hydroxylase NO66
MPGGEKLSTPLGLEWLLRPIAVESFLGEYWEKQPLLVSKKEPEYFRALPGLDAVDELITATTSGSSRSADDGRLVRSRDEFDVSQRGFRMDANGLPDIQDAYRAYRDGYSLVLNRIHRRSSAIADLCRTLEVELHHAVGANMYLTPRQRQGFPPHIDAHDVLILQLHGVKEWYISGGSEYLPLAGAKFNETEFLGEYQQFTVECGDVLYVPRGFPHKAVTSSSSSLHLTVGVYAYRWMDLIIETLNILAEESVQFRAGLPPGFLDTPLDSSQLNEVAGQIQSALADDRITERAKRRLGLRLLGESKAAGIGHFRSIDKIDGLAEDSVVVRAPGVMCRIQPDGEGVQIQFSGNYVSGPAFAESAFRFIAERERFAVSELPGELSIQDKLDLVSRLVSEGLLNIS